jgi:phosphopantothenoylcysteine decarboxylase/phosphopantothenate--cysteine ligase
MKNRSGNRHIVLGVCGSIAAYKSCEIVRGLIKAGAEVRPVLTAAAARFITPLTLSVLSKHAAVDDLYDPSAWDMAHLELATWADLILVAPATADFISRLAAGNANGLLESLILATKAAVAMCPAMDTEMWEHPATQQNIVKIKAFGYSVWGPVKGQLASGREGMGRLIDVEQIVDFALKSGAVHQ